MTLRRGLALLHANVAVCDGAGMEIGWFRSKFLSLGGGFNVLDTQPDWPSIRSIKKSKTAEEIEFVPLRR
jgi:hypothetical protein